MSHIDTPWTRLASRTARGLLARKGATYDDLVRALHEISIAETPKAVELKIQRGSFKCSFFLQLLCALQADLPPELQRILSNRSSWDDACRQIALEQLAKSSMSADKLSTRLEGCGVHMKPAQIESQINSGAFSFAFLLQLAYLLPLAGLDRFVDESDIAKAASEAVAATF